MMETCRRLIGGQAFHQYMGVESSKKKFVFSPFGKRAAGKINFLKSLPGMIMKWATRHASSTWCFIWHPRNPLPVTGIKEQGNNNFLLSRNLKVEVIIAQFLKPF